MARLPTDVAERKDHVGVRWRGWTGPNGKPQLPWEVLSWQTWLPDEVPSLDDVLWVDAPWLDPIDGLGVNATATTALKAWEGPVRTRVGGVSAQNSWSGTPWADVSHVEVPTVVFDQHGRKHLVPLPDFHRNEGIVRRFGDPTATQGDLQWVGFDLRDPDHPYMWECGALRPGPDFGTWFARVVVRWDLSRPWDTTPAGVTASRLPLVAGIPRPDEFARGYIDHAIWFSAACYSTREILWPARGTDGLCSAHPLVAGTRLVLHPDWRPSFILTRDEETLVAAMKRGAPGSNTGRGLIVGDRTDPKQGSAIRSCMDPRVRLRDLGLRLTDFIVLSSAKGP